MEVTFDLEARNMHLLKMIAFIKKFEFILVLWYLYFFFYNI